MAARARSPARRRRARMWRPCWRDRAAVRGRSAAAPHGGAEGGFDDERHRAADRQPVARAAGPAREAAEGRHVPRRPDASRSRSSAWAAASRAAPTPEAFWRLLETGVDAISEVPARALGRRRALRPRPGRPGEDQLPLGRLPRRVDRSTPASSASRRARPSAWTRSSGCCSRWLGRRSRTRARRASALAGSATGVFVGVHSHAATTSGCNTTHPDTDGRLRRHRHSPQPARGPPLVLSSTCTGRRGRRHGLLVVARGRPPRVPEPALGESDARARRRRQPDPVARTSRSPLRACTCSPRTAAARRSTHRPTASCAARAAAWWCSSGCRTRSPTATRPRGDPRLRRQPGRAHQRPHGAERPGAAAPSSSAPSSDAGQRPRTRSATSRRTAPAPRSATRSRSRRSAASVGRAAPDGAPCFLGSVKTNIGPPRGRRRRRRPDQGCARRCATGRSRQPVHFTAAQPAHRAARHALRVPDGS